MIYIFFKPNINDNKHKKIHNFVKEFIKIDKNYCSKNDIYMKIYKNIVLNKNVDINKKKFILTGDIKILFDNIIQIKNNRTNVQHEKINSLNYLELYKYIDYCFINKDDQWYNKKYFLLFLAESGYISLSNRPQKIVGDKLYDKVFCIDGIYRNITSYL
jgi:hypothetical protein